MPLPEITPPPADPDPPDNSKPESPGSAPTVPEPIQTTPEQESPPPPKKPTPAPPYQEPEFKDGAWRRNLGIFATIAWLIVFATGLLIPSEYSRATLGWKPDSDTDNVIKKIETRVSALEKATQAGGEPPAEVGENASAETGSTPENRKSEESRSTIPEDLARELKSLNLRIDAFIADPPAPPDPGNKLSAFLIATISFVPINVAILCILAGCIGACCVSEELVRDVRMQINTLKDTAEGDELRRKLNFLTEHPVYSAIRGLVVYLLITSGLFVFAGSQPLIDPANQSSALAGYIKFAGIFSFFSYFAGHDPTVFTSMIRMGGGKVLRSPTNSSSPSTQS